VAGEDRPGRRTNMLFRRRILSQLFCLAIMLLPVIAHA